IHNQYDPFKTVGQASLCSWVKITKDRNRKCLDAPTSPAKLDLQHRESFEPKCN
ncbi:hypothetical protein F2P79_015879, partial [Pimephales promelas]